MGTRWLGAAWKSISYLFGSFLSSKRRNNTWLQKKRKKRKLIRRYVDKTGGNENWIISFRFVCSVDFTQKFSYAGTMSMF